MRNRDKTADKSSSCRSIDEKAFGGGGAESRGSEGRSARKRSSSYFVRVANTDDGTSVHLLLDSTRSQALALVVRHKSIRSMILDEKVSPNCSTSVAKSITNFSRNSQFHNPLNATVVSSPRCVEQRGLLPGNELHARLCLFLPPSSPSKMPGDDPMFPSIVPRQSRGLTNGRTRTNNLRTSAQSADKSFFVFRPGGQNFHWIRAAIPVN
jgi:hypothetical protein